MHKCNYQSEIVLPPTQLSTQQHKDLHKWFSSGLNNSLFKASKNTFRMLLMTIYVLVKPVIKFCIFSGPFSRQIRSLVSFSLIQNWDHLRKIEIISSCLLVISYYFGFGNGGCPFELNSSGPDSEILTSGQWMCRNYNLKVCYSV